MNVGCGHIEPMCYSAQITAAHQKLVGLRGVVMVTLGVA